MILSEYLDTCTTYHVYPNRDWFSNFEKLDDCYIVMSDDHPCSMKGIGTSTYLALIDLAKTFHLYVRASCVIAGHNHHLN